MRKLIVICASVLLLVAATVALAAPNSASATSCTGTSVCIPGGGSTPIHVGQFVKYAGNGSTTSYISFPACYGLDIWVGATRIHSAGADCNPSPTTTTTVSPSSTTSSTSPATTTTVASGGSACGLAAAAFCETFDQPHNGGTQTGDLDPIVWGVSRVGQANPGQNLKDAMAVSHLVGCGSVVATPPPADVRVCGGQMLESLNDGATVENLDTYPKQPFNFAGRTGTVVFDVSANSDGTHAAWPEFIITDKPVPGVRRSISFQNPAHALNEVGFAIDGCNGQPSLTAVGVVYYTVAGAYHELQGSRPNCITKGSSAAMNHIRVAVSQSHIDVYGTDAGSTTEKLLAAEDVPLTFTQGLVWLTDVHYNARKAIEPCECGTQFDHTFAWDNLGFDGPKTYRDRGFDVPYSNTAAGTSTAGDPLVNVGYGVPAPTTLTVTGVAWDQTPTGAQVVLNDYSFNQVRPSISVNGNTPIDTAWTANDSTALWRTLSVPVPVSQVHAGSNTITITSTDGSTLVANVSLIMVAAAVVP